MSVMYIIIACLQQFDLPPKTRSELSWAQWLGLPESMTMVFPHTKLHLQREEEIVMGHLKQAMHHILRE